MSTPSSPAPPTSPARSPTRTATRTTSSPSSAYRWTGSQWEDYSLAFTETFNEDPADDAQYDVAALVPGTYRVEFDAFDEIPQGISEAAHEFWNDQPSLELAQDVVVTSAGQVLEGYDAVLVRDQYPNEVENVTAPAITGNPVVGQALTASPGTWNLTATTFRYQWFAGSTPVGTNAPTYAPTAADVGKTITVTVLGSVAGIGSAAATSAPTAAVTAPPAPPTRRRRRRRRRPRRSRRSSTSRSPSSRAPSRWATGRGSRRGSGPPRR